MKKGILILLGIITAGFIIVNTGPVQDEIYRIKAFLDPRLGEKIYAELLNKPNAYLLKQTRVNNYKYRAIASEILIEKKDPTLVPEFIKMLKSKDPKQRGTAIVALGKIGDERAIPILMEIVKQGSNNIHYRNALMALSEMRYEAIIPEILKLAETKIENDNRPQQYAIEMMSYYDNPIIENKLRELSNSKWNLISNSARSALDKINARRERKPKLNE